VVFLRAALGAAARCSQQLITNTLGFSFANVNDFLKLSRIFEDVGVSAYLGATHSGAKTLSGCSGCIAGYTEANDFEFLGPPNIPIQSGPPAVNYEGCSSDAAASVFFVGTMIPRTLGIEIVAR